MIMKGATSGLIVIGAIATVLILVGTAKFDWNLFATLGSGFATLSLSSVNFQSNNDVVGGDAWVLTVVQNGMGQYATGTFTTSQISDVVDNKQASNDFTIKMRVDEQTARYGITYQGRNIKHMDYKKGTYPFYSESDCRNNEAKGGEYFYRKEGGSFNAWCFWESNTAGYGLLSTPSTTFSSTIDIESGGKTATGSINSMSQTSISLKNPVTQEIIGYVSWLGSLTSGELPPIASDQKISSAYRYSSNGWFTIDEQTYQDWYMWSGFSANFVNCVDNGGYGRMEYCPEEYNRREANVLVGKSLVNQVGGSATVAGSSLTSGQVSLGLAKQVQYPLMTLYIKKEFVNTISIVVPVGTPKIVSAISQEFKTGSTGYITIVMTSVNGDSSMEVYAECGSPFSQVGTTQYLNVKEGIQSTLFIPITANVLSDTSGSCKVTAKDRNNPSLFDSVTVSVKSSPIVLCNSGETRCNGRVIEKCVVSGWVADTTCTYTCEIRSGSAVCGELPPEECEGFFRGLKCGWNDFWSGMFIGIGKIGLIVVLMLVAFFVLQLRGGRK